MYGNPGSYPTHTGVLTSRKVFHELNITCAERKSHLFVMQTKNGMQNIYTPYRLLMYGYGWAGASIHDVYI